MLATVGHSGIEPSRFLKLGSRLYIAALYIYYYCVQCLAYNGTPYSLLVYDGIEH